MSASGSGGVGLLKIIGGAARECLWYQLRGKRRNAAIGTRAHSAAGLPRRLGLQRSGTGAHVNLSISTGGSRSGECLSWAEPLACFMHT